MILLTAIPLSLQLLWSGCPSLILRRLEIFNLPSPTHSMSPSILLISCELPCLLFPWVSQVGIHLQVQGLHACVDHSHLESWYSCHRGLSSACYAHVLTLLTNFLHIHHSLVLAWESFVHSTYLSLYILMSMASAGLIQEDSGDTWVIPPTELHCGEIIARGNHGLAVQDIIGAFCNTLVLLFWVCTGPLHISSHFTVDHNKLINKGYNSLASITPIIISHMFAHAHKHTCVIGWDHCDDDATDVQFLSGELHAVKLQSRRYKEQWLLRSIDSWWCMAYSSLFI